jgi:hypothetical protein
LLEFEPKGKDTNLTEALKYVSNLIKKKAIIFVLSDFLTDDYSHTLKILSGKHDVTGIRVYDEREQSIPNVGLVQMLDRESGELIMVNTGSKSVRNAYGAYFKDRENYFRDSFSKSGAGMLSTMVGESYVKKLLGYFKTRG